MMNWIYKILKIFDFLIISFLFNMCIFTLKLKGVFSSLEFLHHF